jgi:hypothetical protein
MNIKLRKFRAKKPGKMNFFVISESLGKLNKAMMRRGVKINK